MKLLRDKLAGQLEKLRPAVAKTAAVKAFSYVWFDGKLARAYNGSLGIVVPLATDFKLGVPGQLLYGLVSTTSSKEVELTIERDQLRVQAGRAKALLPTLPGEDMAWEFPATIASTVPMLELTEPLLRGLKRVLLVKPKKPQRIEHHGVVLSVGPGALLMYTTDSKALARASVAQKSPAAADKVVLPRAFVEQIVAYLPVGSKLYFAKNCFCARGPSVHVYCNLLDSTGLVSMEELVQRFISEREPRGKLPGDIEESLKRFGVVAAKVVDAAVSLEIKGKELLLSADYPGGSVDDALELAETMPTAKVAVELAHLRLGVSEAASFGIASGALALYDKDFLYLMAGRWVPERYEKPAFNKSVSRDDMDDEIPF